MVVLITLMLAFMALVVYAHDESAKLAKDQMQLLSAYGRLEQQSAHLRLLWQNAEERIKLLEGAAQRDYLVNLHANSPEGPAGTTDPVVWWHDLPGKIDSPVPSVGAGWSETYGSSTAL